MLKRFAFLILLAGSACSQSVEMSSEEMAACEVTLRDLWSPPDSDFTDYYLGVMLEPAESESRLLRDSIGGIRPPWLKDFPSEFYTRFMGLVREGVRVRPISELDFKEMDLSTRGWRDTKWVGVCSLPREIEPDRWELWSGYSCGSLCGRFCTHIVMHRDGEWILEESHSCMVS